MLARRNRFHGHNSLTYVYRHGSLARGSQLGVRYVRNDKRQAYRLAVIVSRKVHKSAVQRNRVRRRVYELVRSGPPIVIPYDIVVTVFSDQVVKLPADELSRLVRNLFNKAGIYQKHKPQLNRSGHDIVKAREDQRTQD